MQWDQMATREVHRSRYLGQASSKTHSSSKTHRGSQMQMKGNRRT